jgi:zinc finger SWIM domain-containing protein 3
LEAINPTLWTEAFFPGRRYGHNTSNIVETQNNILKLDREFPILTLLDSIYHRVMEKRALRSQTAAKLVESGKPTAPYVKAILRDARQSALANETQISSITEARVVQPNKSTYVVNLANGTCTCKHFQNSGIPCGHALSTIHKLGHSVLNYLPDNSSSGTWAITYTETLPPINTSQLQIIPEDPCYPPITRAPRGRPPKERIRKGIRRQATDRVNASSRCRTCGQTGHNKLKCRQPHQ